jgi:hypothetical protein
MTPIASLEQLQEHINWLKQTTEAQLNPAAGGSSRHERFWISGAVHAYDEVLDLLKTYSETIRKQEESRIISPDAGLSTW